jgi:hypothetical protein
VINNHRYLYRFANVYSGGRVGVVSCDVLLCAGAVAGSCSVRSGGRGGGGHIKRFRYIYIYGTDLTEFRAKSRYRGVL